MSANIGNMTPVMFLLLSILTAVGTQGNGSFNNENDSSVEVTSPVKTTFSCSGRPAGFYADVSSDCQIYHTCDEAGRLFSHTCPERTRFQQRTKVCDHWYMVECNDTEVESKVPTPAQAAAASPPTAQGRKSHRHSQRVIATFPYQPGSQPRQKSSSKSSQDITEKFQIGTASNEAPLRINKPISTSTESSSRTSQFSTASVIQTQAQSTVQSEDSAESTTHKQTQKSAPTATISRHQLPPSPPSSPPSSQRQPQQLPLPSTPRQLQQSLPHSSLERKSQQSPLSSSQRQPQQLPQIPSPPPPPSPFQQRQQRQQKSQFSPLLREQIPQSSAPQFSPSFHPQSPSLQQQPPLSSPQNSQSSQPTQTQSPLGQPTFQPSRPSPLQFSSSSPRPSTARTTYSASPISSSTLPPRRYTENIYLVTDPTPRIPSVFSQTTGGFTSSTSTNQGGVISQIRYVTPYREARIERILVPPRETQAQTTPLPIPDKFTNNPYFESYFKTSFTISSPSSPGPVPTANFSAISEGEEVESDENRIEIVIPDTRKMFYIPDTNYDPGDISDGHGTVLVIDLPVKNSMKFQKVPVAEARNHDCPQCHPSFLIPGQCKPCVLIR